MTRKRASAFIELKFPNRLKQLLTENKSKKASDKSMSKTVFERWATMAERLRDEALVKYKNAKTEEEKTRIAEEFKKAINCY